MKILLVPPNDWLCHPLTSRLHYIFERLADRYEVNVINFKIGGFCGKKQRTTKTFLHDATLIPAYDLSTYYILNAPYHYKLIGDIIHKTRADIVITSNILASSIAIIKAKREKKPVVYDYLDHFPDSASLYYKNKAKKILVRSAVDFLVRKNLEYVDKIVIPSESLERMLQTTYNVSKDRLSLIPNGVDLDVFKPIERINALRKLERLDLQDYLVIVFTGSVESRFDLETPIRAVTKLANAGFKVKLLIVGPELSDYHLFLKNKYSKSSAVEFVGYVDSILVPFYICAADICLAPYRVIEMNFSLTLKLFEYLACRKIVFMTNIPDARKKFENNIVFYNDVEDLTEKILDVKKNQPTYLRNSNECDNIISQYSWQKIADSYGRLLESLVGN